MLDDDIGTKYTTTHRCFGSPCKDDEDKQNVQLSATPWKSGLEVDSEIDERLRKLKMQNHNIPA